VVPNGIREKKREREISNAHSREFPRNVERESKMGKR